MVSIRRPRIEWRSTGPNHAIGVVDRYRVIVEDGPNGLFIAQVSDDTSGKVYAECVNIRTREEALECLNVLLETDYQ